MSERCDGTRDCDDGTDELQCPSIVTTPKPGMFNLFFLNFEFFLFLIWSQWNWTIDWPLCETSRSMNYCFFSSQKYAMNMCFSFIFLSSIKNEWNEWTKNLWNSFDTKKKQKTLRSNKYFTFSHWRYRAVWHRYLPGAKRPFIRSYTQKKK